jgi:hypothetical protein
MGRPARRLVVRSLARILVATVVLFGLYAWIPLGQRPEGSVLLQLVLSLLLVAAVVSWQIVAVMRSQSPGLRAVEGVAMSALLLVLVFASMYFAIETTDSGNFSELLTRVDALYFSVTVFASVGFGDIVPVSQLARMMVMVQMVADLILIGLIAKVLVGAVQRRQRVLASTDGHMD